MTGWRRDAVCVGLGTVLSVEVATITCVPLDIGPGGWIAACAGYGLLWSWRGERIFNQYVAAWRRAWNPSLPARAVRRRGRWCR